MDKIRTICHWIHCNIFISKARINSWNFYFCQKRSVPNLHRCVLSCDGTEHILGCYNIIIQNHWSCWLALWASDVKKKRREKIEMLCIPGTCFSPMVRHTALCWGIGGQKRGLKIKERDGLLLNRWSTLNNVTLLKLCSGISRNTWFNTQKP